MDVPTAPFPEASNGTFAAVNGILSCTVLTALDEATFVWLFESIASEIDDLDTLLARTSSMSVLLFAISLTSSERRSIVPSSGSPERKAFTVAVRARSASLTVFTARELAMSVEDEESTASLILAFNAAVSVIASAFVSAVWARSYAVLTAFDEAM